jgi:hypothetical protein
MDGRGADWAAPQPKIANPRTAIRENFWTDIAGTLNLIGRLKNTQPNPVSMAIPS